MALKGINKVTLLGHIGKTPVIRYTVANEPMAVFRVATGEYWKDKTSGEYLEKTEWHNVVVFTPFLAEVIAVRAHSGSQVYIEGKMVTRKWTDQHDVQRSQTEVIVEGFHGIVQMLSNMNDPDLNL